ncbi:uncharacterized protein METZ01_LOCUS96330, partial [marine metagenome]
MIKSDEDIPDSLDGTPVSILPFEPTAHNSSCNVEFSANMHKSRRHLTPFSKSTIT